MEGVMKRSLYSTAFAVMALSSIGFSNGASAATASIASESASPTQSTATSSTIATPFSTSGVFDVSTTGSVPFQQQSPFTTAVPYSVISGIAGGTSPADEGSAVYNIAAGVTSISVLWGSPDAYNSIIFFTGGATTGGVGTGSPVATFTGSSLADATKGEGYDIVTFDISGVSSVEFADNGQAAFEYADLNLDVTPIPAALPLFASGLLLIGFFAWRKKGNAFAMSAAV
jgi:hypothetical protein